MREKPDLKYLFAPRAIAHVGASPKDTPGRFWFLRYLQDMGYPGKLFPVNPKYQEVFGLKCYPTLADTPGEIDLVILALPATLCPKTLAEVPAGKLKFVIVHTSGFSEIDKNDLEQELLDLARAKNFRIIGPNCMGVFSQESRVCFWEDQCELKDRPGWLGYISQSGGLTIDVISGGIDQGIGYNKAISLGNQIDVSISELMSFMAADPAIKVIATYVEDIKNGRKFIETLQGITPSKPVLVWKGGLTRKGQAASKTHTGSMSSNSDIFRAAMKQAGAILIDNFQEMIQMLCLLRPPVSVPGKRLGLICPGGGNTVSISDAFSAEPDLELPLLSEESRAQIQALLPEENVDLKNPVDPGAVGVMKLDKVAAIVGRDPNVDTLILMITDEIVFHFKEDNMKKMIAFMMADMMKKVSEQIGKPVIINLMQVRDNNEEVSYGRRLMVDALIARGISWTNGSFIQTARIFAKLARYAKFLEKA